MTQSQLEAINREFSGGAVLLKNIKHESVIAVQDYFSEVDRQYLVLEAIAGNDLTTFLRPDTPRPSLDETLAWADQILRALDHLHRLAPPVLHREIRPSNIKLNKDRRVKLLTAVVPVTPAADSVMLIPGQASINTSFNYKPLEQLWTGLDPASQRVILNSYDERAAGNLLRSLDARCDLYSVAASLYQVLTDVIPCDALERSIAILDGKPDPLAKPYELNDGIPEAVSDVFSKALSLRREDRFDSAIVMLQSLRSAAMTSAESASTKEYSETSVDRTDNDAAVLDIDDELQKLDARKLELEAEKERQAAVRERLQREAEAERTRAEQEALMRESETVRQQAAIRLAEEEQTRREADLEKISAEQRLVELKEEQERHRREHVRIEEEARRELELVEQRLRAISAEKDSALQSGTVVDRSAIEPTMVDLKSETSPKSPDLEISFYPEHTRGSRKLPLFAGLAAAGVAIATGGWYFFVNKPVAAEPPQPVAILEPRPIEIPLLAPEASVEQSVEPEAARQPEEEAVSDVAPAAATAPPVRQATAADRAKRPQAIPAKKTEARKKVTVDDLINDN